MSESQNSYAEAGQRKSAHRMIPCIEKNHPCSDRKPNEWSSEAGAGRQWKGQVIKRHEDIQRYSIYCGGIFTGVYICQTIKFVCVQFIVCQLYLKSAVTNTQNPSLYLFDYIYSFSLLFFFHLAASGVTCSM